MIGCFLLLVINTIYTEIVTGSVHPNDCLSQGIDDDYYTHTHRIQHIWGFTKTTLIIMTIIH